MAGIDIRVAGTHPFSAYGRLLASNQLVRSDARLSRNHGSMREGESSLADHIQEATPKDATARRETRRQWPVEYSIVRVGSTGPLASIAALGTDNYEATRRRGLDGIWMCNGGAAEEMAREKKEAKKTSRGEARGQERMMASREIPAAAMEASAPEQQCCGAVPVPGRWLRPGACNLLPLTSLIYSISTEQPNRPPWMARQHPTTSQRPALFAPLKPASGPAPTGLALTWRFPRNPRSVSLVARAL